ncbi:MAG: hypothetical protein HY914_12325 [Desulfomonile tiedjei]|nr:hypothetical protein [Desulfomonile tiedjei]
MTYGLDYDFFQIFYAVVYTIAIGLGIYALVNPDFFRSEDRKGQPRSARDSLLGTCLIVAGVSLAAFTFGNLFFGLQYRTMFSEATVEEFQSLFCKTARSSRSENLPVASTLPAPPYVLIHCMEKGSESAGVDCSAECTVVYRPEAHPADSAEGANAYIFIVTHDREIGPVQGISAQVIVFDKTNNQASFWFDTQVSRGNTYSRTIGPGPLQRLVNRVAAKIAEEQKAPRTE